MIDAHSAYADAAYIRPVVKIELGARSDTEPCSLPLIQPKAAVINKGSKSRLGVRFDHIVPLTMEFVWF